MGGGPCLVFLVGRGALVLFLCNLLCFFVDGGFAVAVVVVVFDGCCCGGV